MKKILVADDDPGICTVVKTALGKDFSVTAVADGRRALDELQRDAAYDCVLLDVQMPELDGLSVLRAIRQSPSLKGVPVVILTGDETLSTQVAAMSEGVATFFRKPFSPSQLLAIVTTLTKKR
jgi:CheY-like chemotaxis protein